MKIIQTLNTKILKVLHFASQTTIRFLPEKIQLNIVIQRLGLTNPKNLTKSLWQVTLFGQYPWSIQVQYQRPETTDLQMKLQLSPEPASCLQKSSVTLCRRKPEWMSPVTIETFFSVSRLSPLTCTFRDAHSNLECSAPPASARGRSVGHRDAYRLYSRGFSEKTHSHKQVGGGEERGWGSTFRWFLHSLGGKKTQKYP